MERCRTVVDFFVVPSLGKPGVVIQAVMPEGHVVLKPNIEKARDLMQQLNAAIAAAERQAREAAA